MVAHKVFLTNLFTNCTFCGTINVLRKLNILEIRYFFSKGDTVPFFDHTIFEFGKNANSVKIVWFNLICLSLRSGNRGLRFLCADFGWRTFYFARTFAMIITFCGHSQFARTEKYEEQVLSILEQAVGDSPAEFFLGGYGAFDDFAYGCCKKYQTTHPNTKLVYITPYISHKSNLKDNAMRYNAIIYPEIENAPLRYAISHRNRWMVEKADLVICFITHRSGGAYQTYRQAISKNKTIVNLADCS